MTAGDPVDAALRDFAKAAEAWGRVKKEEPGYEPARKALRPAHSRLTAAIDAQNKERVNEAKHRLYADLAADFARWSVRDPDDQKYWSMSFPRPTREGYLRAMRWAAEYIRGIDPRAFEEAFAKLAAFERERWERAATD